jgi:hypothetical protein
MRKKHAAGVLFVIFTNGQVKRIRKLISIQSTIGAFSFFIDLLVKK